MTKEVMKQAMLDEIELVLTDPQSKLSNGAQYALRYVYQQIQAITEAKKQEQSEPVGKFAKFTDGIWREVTVGSSGVFLYTHPKEWVGKGK